MIVVNKNICIGCGLCTAIADKTFRIGKNGKSEVFNQNGDSEEKINEAISSCPVSAISIKK